MCIRDSRVGEGGGAVGGDVDLGGLRSLGDAPVIGAGEAAAVSYTHLRAHETVLDLVCRLLLEKKKIQIE